MKTETAPSKTGASEQFIKKTFSRNIIDWFGTAEVKVTFGVDVPVPPTPGIFSESVLARARKMDCCVVLQHDRSVDGKPLTLRYIHDTRGNKDFLDGRLLCDTGWYGKLPLFTEQVPRPGIFIKGRGLIPDSAGKTFVGESLVAAGFVETLFGNELPEEYSRAIEELRTEAERLEKLCRSNSDWQEGARQAVALSFSRLFRDESLVEVLYRVLLGQKVNGQRLFGNIYARTNILSPGGCIVSVGRADARGAILDVWRPDGAYSSVGFSFSCSGELKLVS